MHSLLFIFPVLFFLMVLPCEDCEARELRAVLLLESNAQDYGPLDSLRQGFMALQSQDGIGSNIQADIRVATTYPEQKKLFHEVASGSYDVVVLATPIFHTLLNNNAGNYRRQNFLCLDADITAPNIVSIVFADVQSAYLCGVAVATLAATFPQSPSDDGTLSLGMIDDGSLAQEAMHKAFLRGVGDTNNKTPSKKTIKFFHSTLAMTATEQQGRHTAEKLIQSKVPVILSTVTGTAALGVQKACLEHDTYLVGMDQHLSDNTPSAESFSLKKDMGSAIKHMLLHIQEKGFPVGQILEKTVAHDSVGCIASFHNIAPSVSDDVTDALAGAMDALLKGHIVLEGPRGLCQCF